MGKSRKLTNGIKEIYSLKKATFPLLSKAISTYKLKVVYVLTPHFVQSPSRNVPCAITSELLVPTDNFHPKRKKQYVRVQSRSMNFKDTNTEDGLIFLHSVLKI